MRHQYVAEEQFGRGGPPERLGPLPQMRARQRHARGDRRTSVLVMLDGVDAGEGGGILAGHAIGIGRARPAAAVKQGADARR